ncbi:hypothetical protein ODZ84_00390 [Chryseobacterium fluminis]|uniref:hypothetical protein n=1 Tax=Chryseobacterium fluminis TaxID=2983606 RepID=UPI00225A401F|nr:hypothetical protein [Chryseobacterium sp. MMS21-Ot14]UZT98062.1 hypothetical protein ODZ84_00390 [Chryseobacterium sp. MMS21-Ot14]
MKLKTLFTLGIGVAGPLFYSQIRIANSIDNQAAAGSSAFIDASSNTTYNSSSNVGKGLLFPRTDLTGFTSFGGGVTGIPTSFPSRYDGLIVYNTSTSGVAGIGSTEGTLTAGYWYYDNKSTTINGGTWRPLSKMPVQTVTGDQTADAWVDNASGTRVELGKKSDGTARAAGTEVVIKDNGNVGIGTVNPAEKLRIAGDGTNSPLGITNLNNGPVGNEYFNLVINNADGKVYKSRVASPEQVPFYYQRYQISNVNRDFLKNFDTNIPTSKYTVVVVGSSFDRVLSKPPADMGGDFCSYTSHAYKEGTTWRLYADYKNCISTFGNGQWIITILIIPKKVIRENNNIQVDLGGSENGSAPSPVD